MKALFFDVDGTLISETTHQIPASALEALRHTREKGNKVFINSGRTAGMLKRIMKMVDVDGYLCGCGTELIYEGKSIYYKKLTEEMKKRLQAASEQYGILVHLEGQHGWHCAPSAKLLDEHPKYIALYQNLADFIGMEGGIDPTPYYGDYEISKFCIETDDGAESGHPSDMEGFRKAFGDEFIIIDRGHGFYENVPNGHGKGAAVDRILDYLHLGKDDAYGFGDSSNDEEMFRAVGHPVAMGHHDAVLEAYHPFITKQVEEDGLFYAMEQLGLL